MNLKPASNPKRNAVMMFRAGAIAAAALLLSAFGSCPPSTPPPPSAPNAKLLCFPQFQGIPEKPNPPVIDGDIGGVPGDLGWSFSSRYVFGNGTSAPDAIVQIVKDSSYVYLSFEVNNDTNLDDEDAILLVFRPTGGTPANDRRIIIFPNEAGVPKNNQAPRLISYWNNSANWNTPTAATNNPAWLLDGAGAHGMTRVTNPDFNHWYVETKIPIGGGAANNGNPAADTAINLPAGDFGFYFDIIRVAGNAQEFAWPEGKVLSGAAPANVFTPEANTPPDTDWGSGTFTAQACNGVNFDWYDIKIDHAGAAGISDNEIALNASSNVKNIFQVTPHNDSVDKDNHYIAAPASWMSPQGIVATFKIRNYGVAGATQWDLVGNVGSPINLLTPNPTTPGVQIPAAVLMPNPLQGSTTISTDNWKLNASQQNLYQTAATPDQCIYVELGVANGTQGNISFKNKAAYRNMNFVTTASPFSRTADLGTHGYQPEGGQKELEFYLNVFNYFNASPEKWETKIENAQEVGKNQYLVRARPEQSVKLNATVSPPPIDLPTNDLQVPPTTGLDKSRLVPIKVQPGDLITILSDGSIQVRKTDDPSAGMAGPNGLDTTGRGQAGTAKTQSTDYPNRGYLLSADQEPERHVGGLVGSWDNFGKTSFLIGSMTTLKVPKNADTLFLAINDTTEGYRQETGNGFKVQVIATPMKKMYTSTNSLVSRDPSAEPFVIPAATNLPTWVLCGGRKTARSIRIGQRTFPEVESIGCYGYALNRIGKSQVSTAPPKK
jgi:hypothetical protein